MNKQAMTYAERLISNGARLKPSVFEGRDPSADYLDVVRGILAGERDPMGLVADARGYWTHFRVDVLGYSGAAPFLTAPEAQPKLGKSAVPTYGLMLSPATHVNDFVADNRDAFESDPDCSFSQWARDGYRRVNLCPWASAGCLAVCLNTAGKGRMSTVQRARAARTTFLLMNPWAALILISSEIARAVRKHGSIRVRLNVVSDLRFERIMPELFAVFGDSVRWYDYTAAPISARDDDALPVGYSLTRSAKETHTAEDVAHMVNRGATVAVPMAVRRGEPLPAVWHGMRVIDGDASDDRTLDPAGVIVGLRAKGDAIGDTSGFVRDAYPVVDDECHGCGVAADEECHPFCLSHTV